MAQVVTRESLAEERDKIEQRLAEMALLSDDLRSQELRAEAQTALAGITEKLAEAERLGAKERKQRQAAYAKLLDQVKAVEKRYAALNAKAEKAYRQMLAARDAYVDCWAQREVLAKESRTIGEALRAGAEPGDDVSWRKDAPKPPTTWAFDEPRRRWAAERLFHAGRLSGWEED